MKLDLCPNIVFLTFAAILDESGQINRKVLGPIVFSDKVGTT